MIGEYLQRNDCQQGLKLLGSVRYRDQMIGVRFDVVIAFGGDDNCFSASSANLFDISDYLFILRALGRDEYCRHSIGYQCNRAVFHFCCRKPLSVDITDFL